MYQVAQFFSRICLMSIICSPFRVDTREDQGAIQVRNQNESGGVMSWFGTPASWVVDKYRKWHSRPVSQCSYIDGDPNITSYEVIYRSLIERSSMTPYRLKFHDPTHTITGIACLPKDANTSSPEAEVISGGVGCKEVEIVLTPVQKGDWSCCVQINGIAGNHLEMNPIPNN
jgi:hypothetical protein